MIKNRVDELYYKPANKKKIRNNIRYFFEAFGIVFLYILFRILPLDCASWLGGKVVRKIAPLSKKHKIALMNLDLVFPEKTFKEKEKIALDEWENIGRTLAEYPHINSSKLAKRITFERIDNALKFVNQKKGGFLLSAHYGNWELTSCIMQMSKSRVSFVYRKPNNPFLLKIFKVRGRNINGDMIGKDENSLLKIMKCISQKEMVGMMVDQKLYEGVSVKFLGVDAMTTPAPAIVAKRYGCPILPIKVERINLTANFKVTFCEPLLFEKSKADMAEITKITQQISDIIESWIKEDPSQWLWIHRRWNKEVVAEIMSKRQNAS